MIDTLHRHDDAGGCLRTESPDRNQIGKRRRRRLQHHAKRRRAGADDHAHREIADGADGHGVTQAAPLQSERPATTGDGHGAAGDEPELRPDDRRAALRIGHHAGEVLGLRTARHHDGGATDEREHQHRAAHYWTRA